MNLWALEKQQSLKHLLILLHHEFGEHSFVIDGNQACDQNSIYLVHINEPTTRAYIFIHGQDKDCYGVHLEHPATPDRGPILEPFERLSVQALIDTLSIHLELIPIKPE